ncbi:hypothetical protein [Streptomyces sp. NPDC002785]|uniref:hypothetical protein n=1 Tax=Streptomyces sp. NPDC002785 TaxID=3154543 RepID=UPI003324A43A
MSDPAVWETLIGSSVISAALAGGVAAWIAHSVTEKNQSSRAAIVEENQNLRAEQQSAYLVHRTKLEIRHDLISQMADSAGPLYYVMRHYEMAAARQLGRGIKRDSYRQSLDEQYLKNRSTGKAVEARLATYFPSPEVRSHWHAVMDLSAIAYFDAIGRDTPKLRESCAKPGHSGLGVEELKNRYRVREALRDRYEKSLQAVLSQPIRIGET